MSRMCIINILFSICNTYVILVLLISTYIHDCIIARMHFRCHDVTKREFRWHKRRSFQIPLTGPIRFVHWRLIRILRSGHMMPGTLQRVFRAKITRFPLKLACCANIIDWLFGIFELMMLSIVVNVQHSIVPGWNFYVQEKNDVARSAFLAWVDNARRPRFGHMLWLNGTIPSSVQVSITLLYESYWRAQSFSSKFWNSV